MIESLNLLYFISALSQKITNTIYLRFCGCDKISSIVHFTLREFLCSGDLFGQVWNKKGDRSSQYLQSAKQQGTDSSPAFSSPNIQSSRRKTKDFEIESLYSFLLLDKVFFPLLIRFGRIGPPCLMVLSFADSLSYYSSFQKKKKILLFLEILINTVCLFFLEIPINTVCLLYGAEWLATKKWQDAKVLVARCLC